MIANTTQALQAALDLGLVTTDQVRDVISVFQLTADAFDQRAKDAKSSASRKFSGKASDVLNLAAEALCDDCDALDESSE